MHVIEFYTTTTTSTGIKIDDASEWIQDMPVAVRFSDNGPMATASPFYGAKVYNSTWTQNSVASFTALSADGASLGALLLTLLPTRHLLASLPSCCASISVVRTVGEVECPLHVVGPTCTCGDHSLSKRLWCVVVHILFHH
jgi:hypothetical protein